MKHKKLKKMGAGGAIGTGIGTVAGSFIPIPGASTALGTIGGLLGSRIGRRRTPSEPVNYGTATYKYGGKMKKGRKKYPLGGQLPATQPIGPDAVRYEGPQHEQGGIPIGPQGGINTQDPVAEVEGGETRQGDYIFSDELMVPGTEMTFAEAHEMLLAEGASPEEIDQLAQMQEEIKGDTAPQPQETRSQMPSWGAESFVMKKGGNLPKYEIGGFFNNATAAERMMQPGDPRHGSINMTRGQRIADRAKRMIRRNPGRLAGGAAGAALTIVAPAAYAAVQDARARGRQYRETGIHPSERSALQTASKNNQLGSLYQTPQQSTTLHTEGFPRDNSLVYPSTQPQSPVGSAAAVSTTPQSTSTTSPRLSLPNRLTREQAPITEPRQLSTPTLGGQNIGGLRQSVDIPTAEGQSTVRNTARGLDRVTESRGSGLMSALQRYLPSAMQAGIALRERPPARSPRAPVRTERHDTAPFTQARRQLASGFRSTDRGQGAYARYMQGVMGTAAQESSARAGVDARNIQAQRANDAQRQQLAMRDEEMLQQHRAARTNMLMQAVTRPLDMATADRRSQDQHRQNVMVAAANIPNRAQREEFIRTALGNMRYGGKLKKRKTG